MFNPASLAEQFNMNNRSTIHYNFLPNINSISTDWYECNKAPKTNTSYKYLRIKPKTLFNHVLPVSDSKGIPINVYDIEDYFLMQKNPVGEPFTIRNSRKLSTINNTMFYPKSYPIGLELISLTDNKNIINHPAVTKGIRSCDLFAASDIYTDNYRKIHVLSQIMYNDKTFGYVPLRQQMLLDVGYNFIRYKITQENLFTTQKIISGTLLYDSEYHNKKIYEDEYGNTSDSIVRRSIVPRISIDNNKNPANKNI